MSGEWREFVPPLGADEKQKSFDCERASNVCTSHHRDIESFMAGARPSDEFVSISVF